MRDEDVDSILAKYKHLGQKEVSFDRKGEMEENVFAGDEDGEGFVLDENETDFSEDGKLVEKAEVKDIEKNSATIDVRLKDIDEDCIEDTSDYLTEPEDDDNKEKASNSVTTSDDVDMAQNLAKKRKVNCDQCDWSGGATGLNYHKKSQHVGIKFQCPHCELSSPRAQYLASHILVKHRRALEDIVRKTAVEPIEDADVLEKELRAEVELEVKRAKHQIKNEEDVLTHKSSAETNDLIQPPKDGGPMKEDPDNKSAFKCSQCDWVVGTDNGLRYHKRTVHEGLKNGKYRCNSCYFKSTSKANMESHMMTEHKADQQLKDEDNGCETSSVFPDKLNSSKYISEDAQLITENSSATDPKTDSSDEDDDPLPPYWHQSEDKSGLIFSPARGKSKSFASYQAAVKWLLGTGISV